MTTSTWIFSLGLVVSACTPKSPTVPPTSLSATRASPPPSSAPVAQPVSSVPPRADPRASETTSVQPGINDPYRVAGAAKRWSRVLERDGREIHDRQAEVLAAMDLRPGLVVADIGAGTGLFTEKFAEAVGPTGMVYAVDLMPAFLEHIEARVKRAGLEHVRLVLSTDRTSGLAPASVDVLFLSDVYHHFEYPQHMLASLREALRPGGVMWLIDFHRIPGTSPKWVFEHVRAGKDVVVRELDAAGFEVIDELPLLRDNYVLRLRVRDGSSAL